jgi:hypothetical protein
MTEPTEELEIVVDMELRDWFWTGFSISGYVYHDSKGRFQDGDLITTSYIKEWIPNSESPIAVRTRNSVYVLGRRAGG